jgi:hypothetical protein
MAVADFSGSRSGRPWTKAGGAQRGRAGTRRVLEIAASVSVLLLIMIGALAARFLLSLPSGFAH